MLLSLDISTSITGWAIINKNKQIVSYGHWDLRNPKKFSSFWDKCFFVEKGLNNIFSRFPEINKVLIEQSLFAFSGGKSSAKTLSMLTKFNGIISWIIRKETNIEPDFISATSARKKTGIKIKKGEKGKDKAREFVLDNVREFQAQWTIKGNLKPACLDEIDAIVLCYAGFSMFNDKLNE